MKIITNIPATDKRLRILSSVIGQMSDGIWENTRSMEKYWKSLRYGTDANGNIYLDDTQWVCANPADFFANKIKQIIKVEIDDGRTSGLEWDRMCSVVPDYIDGVIGYNVTVGDCYELYELLKGRNTSKNSYSSYRPYEVELTYGSNTFKFTVDALSEYQAREQAIKNMTSLLTVKVVQI
jgi:hypothetical protein